MIDDDDDRQTSDIWVQNVTFKLICFHSKFSGVGEWATQISDRIL